MGNPALSPQRGHAAVPAGSAFRSLGYDLWTPRLVLTALPLLESALSAQGPLAAIRGVIDSDGGLMEPQTHAQALSRDSEYFREACALLAALARAVRHPRGRISRARRAAALAAAASLGADTEAGAVAQLFIDSAIVNKV